MVCFLGLASLFVGQLVVRKGWTIGPVASEGRRKFEVSAGAQIVSRSNRWEPFCSRSHFGSSHLCSNTALLSRAVRFSCWLHFCILTRRRVMPRRGWVTAPDGWVQIIRGPRPPSERWPKTVRVASAGASKPRQQIQGQAPVGRWRQSEKPRSSVPPEVSMAAAQKRVGGLEAAVAVLAAVGTVDGPEVQVLKQSLQKARRAAQERPITALLSQTEAFVERARKRLQAHDAARQQLVEELEEGEGRLSRLQEAARTQEATVRPAQEVRTDTVDASPIVATNGEQIAWPVERPRVRQRVSPSHIPEVVPPMPTLIPHDLSNWILDRQSDLQSRCRETDRIN